MNTSHVKYRPDIDGLRAVAVIAVVLFHAWPKYFAGGFVGVDIFFVISGYLISKILIEALSKDEFSFWDFYSRRIRRIFPALLTVLTACLVFGWFALLPDEFKSLGKHTAAGAGFVSNLVLWSESGYFDVDSNLKPLLHLWSLGIEEQFYIFWPILLYLAWKNRVGAIYLLAGLFLLSFAANILSMHHSPVATFYSPLTRAWELLIGAGLACAAIKKYKLPGSANLRSILGFSLLLLSFAVISKNRSFPGWWALAPSFGASLVISAPDAWLNKTILTTRILVWIGLISFPLYLWHWPLLSFTHMLDVSKPTNGIISVVILVSIFLAYLTYQYIEKPIRNGINILSDLRVNKATTACLTMLLMGIGGGGFAVFKQDGFIWRSQEISALVQNNNWDSVFRLLASETYDCEPKKIREGAHFYYQTGISRCRQTMKNEQQTIALIGDSHAEHLFWGVAKGLGDQENLVYFTYSCLPLIGLKRLDMEECEKCRRQLNMQSLNQVLRQLFLQITGRIDWRKRTYDPHLI